MNSSSIDWISDDNHQTDDHNEVYVIHYPGQGSRVFPTWIVPNEHIMQNLVMELKMLPFGT